MSGPQVQKRNPQQSLNPRRSNSSLNNAYVPSQASEPKKLKVTLKDLPKNLVQIREASNPFEQRYLRSAHWEANTTYDKRDLVLVRLQYAPSQAIIPDDTTWYQPNKSTFHRIAKSSDNANAQLQLVNLPKITCALHLASLAPLAPLRKRDKLFGKSRKDDPCKQTLRAVIQENKAAARDTDIVLIGLESYWSMIMRTASHLRMTDPEWAEHSFARQTLSQFTAPHGLGIVAVAKLPNTYSPSMEIHVNTPLIIIKDEHNFFGPKV